MAISPGSGPGAGVSPSGREAADPAERRGPQVEQDPAEQAEQPAEREGDGVQDRDDARRDLAACRLCLHVLPLFHSNGTARSAHAPEHGLTDPIRSERPR